MNFWFIGSHFLIKALLVAKKFIIQKPVDFKAQKRAI